MVNRPDYMRMASIQIGKAMAVRSVESLHKVVVNLAAILVDLDGK